MIVLGRIGGGHGLKGWLRIRPFGDDPSGWKKMPVWFLAADESSDWLARDLMHCEAHGNEVIAHLAGIDDRNAADALRGFLVGIPRESLPETKADEFYWADLLAMRVETLSGDLLGSVAGLLETGAHDVLRVTDESGHERLLPFVDAIVREVDRQERLIRVDWSADWE